MTTPFHTLIGTDGDDVLKGTGDRDSINGLGGNDLIVGDFGNDRLFGDDGQDTVRGGDGVDLVKGGYGDDSLVGGAGDDLMFGGHGLDTLIGGAGDDLLSASDRYYESPADLGDSLAGGIGDDTLIGSIGDTLLGGGGDDVARVDAYIGAGGSLFEGGAGHDVLDFKVLAAGDDYVGDLGFLAEQKHADVTFHDITFGGFEGGSLDLFFDRVDVTLAPEVRGWSISVQGSAAGRLTGNAGADVFHDYGQDATLQGLGGDDQLFAGQGGVLDGGAGNDTLTDYDESRVTGGDGNDVLVGGGAMDGGAGDDFMRAIGPGQAIDGGDGADTLQAGLGPETLAGGAGADVYVFGSVQNRPLANPMVVHDADVAQVDLHDIDADGQMGDHDAFTVVDAFDGQAGELTIHYSHKDDVTRVEADTDGDKQANLVILIDGQYVDPAGYVL